jgi:hypothetical protein
MDDLIEPITVTGKRRQKAVGETTLEGGGSASGVGGFRPKPAKITDR